MSEMDSSHEEPELKRQKTDSDTISDVRVKSSSVNDHSGSVTVAQDSSQDTSDLQNDDYETFDEECEIEDNIVCPMDEAQWLSENYGPQQDEHSPSGGQDTVTIRFRCSDRIFYFPKDLLVKNFGYFRAALRTDGTVPRFLEGRSQHFHLPLVSARDFGYIVQFIESGRYRYEPYKPTMPVDADIGCDAIAHILKAVIAADYLGLRQSKYCYNTLWYFAGANLANILLKDRRKLVDAHIKLVQNHIAFAKNGPTSRTDSAMIGKVMADASVRPFLQECMDQPDGGMTSDDEIGDHEGYIGEIDFRRPYTPWPKSGHRSRTDWIQIIRHCKQLRTKNKEYSFQVMEGVSETLRRGDDDRSELPILYEDPLSGWSRHYDEHLFIL